MIKKLNVFRPTVTQIRVSIFAVNLLISLLVIWLFVSRLLEPHDALVARDFKTLTKRAPASSLIYKGGTTSRSTKNVMTRLQVSRHFEVEKRPDPTLSEKPEEPKEDPTVAVGEDETVSHRRPTQLRRRARSPSRTSRVPGRPAPSIARRTRRSAPR